MANHIGSRQFKGIHKPVDVWELTSLSQENLPDSRYLEITDDHMRIKELDVDATTLSGDEREAIQKALSRALVHLVAITPLHSDEK